MAKEKIKDIINELQTTVDDDPNLSSASKESISDLSARLEVMLNGSSEHWEEGLVNELEKQMILYEESHPLLARVFNQLIITLNSIGL